MTNIISILSLPFFFGSCLLFVLPFLSYETFLQLVNHQVQAFQPTNHYLTHSNFMSMIHKARYMGALFLTVFLLINLYRSRLATVLITIKTDATRLHIIFKEWLCKTIHEDNKLVFYSFLFTCVVGFAIRAYYLNQPIKNDEATVFLSFATKPFYVLIAAYTNVGNHIFHTLLMHISWVLFGDPIWAIRLPTFIAGCALIPATYFVIRAGYGPLVALLTTILVSSSSALIEYSVNSRGYEIQALFIMLLLGLGQYLLYHSNRYASVLWIIITALGFWTLPTIFYAYGGLALWFLLSLLLQNTTPVSKRLATAKHFLLINVIAGLLVLLLYSPVILTFGMGHMDTMLNQAALVNLYDIIPRSQDLWQLWTRNIPAVVQPVLLGCALLGVIFQAKISRFSVNLLLCCVAWLCLTTLVIQPYALMTTMLRLWLTHSIFLYLSIAIGFTVLINSLRWLQLKESYGQVLHYVLSLALLCIISWQEFRQKTIHQILEDSFHDAHSVVEYFKQNLQPGDWILAACPYGTTLRYELAKQNIPYRIVTASNDTGETFTLFAYNTDKTTTPKTHERVFIIEVPGYKNLAKVIEESHVHRWYAQGIHLVAQFSKANLYTTQLAGDL